MATILWQFIEEHVANELANGDDIGTIKEASARLVEVENGGENVWIALENNGVAQATVVLRTLLHTAQ